MTAEWRKWIGFIALYSRRRFAKKPEGANRPRVSGISRLTLAGNNLGKSSIPDIGPDDGAGPVAPELIDVSRWGVNRDPPLAGARLAQGNAPGEIAVAIAVEVGQENVGPIDRRGPLAELLRVGGGVITTFC